MYELSDKEYKEYYFDNHLHMAFIGVVQEETSVLRWVNRKMKLMLQENDENGESLFSLFEGNRSIENFTYLIISEDEIAEEYLRLFNSIHSQEDINLEKKTWKYFHVNEEKTKQNYQSLSLKSIKPEGILTNFISNDGERIYVDLFTKPQIHHGKVNGFQGLITIENERRQYFLRQKKESELNVFHSFLVDMKNKAPSMLNNVLIHEELPPRAKLVIQKAKNYIEGVIDQSVGVLSLFNQYMYSDSPLHPRAIVQLEKVVKGTIKKLDGKVHFDFTMDDQLKKEQTLLIPEVFEYFLIQLIKNAIKEYDRNKIEKSKRSIHISFKKKTLYKTHMIQGTPTAMKVEAFSRAVS